LAEEKQQLQERLLQAHAFISCLQQHTGWSAPPKAAASGQQQHRPALLQTPSDVSAAAAGAATAVTPVFASTGSVRATAEGLVLALPAPAAADTVRPAPGAAVARQRGAEGDGCPASFATPPAMGHSNPLFDLPATPGSVLMSGELGAAHAATAVVPHGHITWPQDPASPILAAATRSTAVGEHRQRVQHSAATHELQDVHQEQLGLREEISRAKSALADIAGQLRASIGAAAVSKTSSASVGGSVVGGDGSAATAGASSRVNMAMTTPASASSGGSQHQGPLQATASAAGSSNSRSSTGTAATASHGSRAKGSAGRIHGPCKLQELQKAAAAVKSVSAARSGSSSSKGSMIASKATSDLGSACRTAAGAAGAPSASAGQRSRSKHWDELSDSCSDTTSSPGQSAGSSASAPAANASAAGQGLVVSAAASGQGPSRSDVKGAAPGVASGSGKGSISLDQLIADAETVSLEYGMSPGGPATATPAAAVAASAAQATSTPAAHSCPAVAAGLTPDQQSLGSTLQQHFAFVAQPVSQLVTPGSAASSAGAGAGRLVPGNRAWLTKRHLEGTPASAAVNNPQPDDMQSCIRSGHGSHAPLPGPQQQQATPAAPTPMGLERVASNTMLDALDTATAGLQDQQQQLLLPGATGSVCAAEAAATGCGSSVQQQGAVTPGSSAAGAAAAAGVSGLLSGSRAGTASVLLTLQQQQGSLEGGASAGSSAPVTPSGAGAAACTPPAPLSSPPSALKKAAAALLSSISPAGLMTAATPEGQGRTGAMAAAAAAGLSPQLLQHLTPEWLRSLKRKCKQESEQLQLLRRQMGLATPEVDVTPQELQLLQVLPALPQQQQLDTAVRPAEAGASAAGPGEGSSSCAAAAAATAAAAAAAAHDSTGCLDDTQFGAAVGTCSQGSVAQADELSMQQVQDDGMVGTTAACSSMSSRAGAAAGLTGSSSSLGLHSSRSSIDRLRRRAIMAQANAASASPLPLDQDAVTAASAAWDACPVAAATAASQVAGCAAADTALMDDQLDRCSSAGSLADYMRQHSLRDDSAPVSRTSSITPGMYPVRPECPTPGSLYSDNNDAVGSADEALLGRGAPVSPDMLLAGLQSSRAAARQLQHQLMQQLEKTTSMPSVLSRQHEAALRAVPALHRTNSAAAAVAAAAAGTRDAEESSDSRCDSPALEGSTQLVVAPQAATHAAGLPTGMDPAAPVLTAAAQARASTYSSSTGSRQARPLHQQMSRLMEEEQQAAASPATPGAALNAGAESRLLSPSVQLQLVFEGEGSGDEASTAEVGGLEQQPGHVQEVNDFNVQQQQPQQCPSGTDLNTCSTFLPLQQRQQQPPVLSSASQQASDSSSCMLPLGIAAKAQPAADSAVAAPSPPVSVLSATPGSAWPQASVKAHQLSGVSAGTLTASTPLSVYDGIEPQSCARAPTMMPAATAAEVACDVGELISASPAIHGAADAAAAAAGGAKSAATRLQTATKGRGLMGDAASRSHSSSSPSCSHVISERGPSLGSWAAADTPAAAQTDATAAAQFGATQNSTLLGSGTSPGHAQQQGDARSLPILLGESPSTKPQQPRTHKAGYSSTPASTASKVSAAGAAASSAGITSGSCLTSATTPHLSLGRSPGSEVESAHTATGNMEAAASVADAGTTVTAAAGSSKPDDAGIEAVNTAVAAAAAIAAAFAAPQAVGSAAPAVSSTTWGSGSCMFATPAVEFNSLGGAYSCCSEGSDAQAYYTGLQHSSHSSRHVTATAAPSGRGAAGQGQSAQTAGGGAEVAFAGFRVTERCHTEDEGISSPVASIRAAGSVAAEVGGINQGAAAPVVTATAQKKLLQQLLASPGDDEAFESSPESPLAAEEPRLPDTTTAASAQPAPAAAAALTLELAGVGAEGPGVDAVLSPTLSELGFVAASTSADVATAKRLQQEQQQQELRQGKSRGVAADLDGLSFEQRLDLLCAEEASSSDGSPVALLGAAAGGSMHQQQQQASQLAHSCSSTTSSGGVGSSSKCLAPSSNGGVGPHSAEGTSTQEDEAAQTGAPGLQGSMACCATQTSPLLVSLASTPQDRVRSGMFSHHTAVPSQHSFEAAPTVGHIMGGMHVVCMQVFRVM